jgi:hypothetical protein
MPSSSQPHRANEPLFETARGRVMTCRCCSALELRFGNALLVVNAAELGSVGAALAASATDAPGRPTTLTLGDTGCGWVFDAGEADELRRLVAGATLLLELGVAPRRDPRPDAQEEREPWRDASSHDASPFG